MTNLEMFYFVGRCLSIDEHPEFREVMVQKISDDEIEWAQFVSLCSNHLILPVIYLKFKAHKLIEHLPEELAEFLKEIYDLNLARNEQILLQIKDILKLLNANDIFPTFLKGTGNLLDGLYSDKGERMIGDIDFLVPEEDYLKAAKILENDGYIRNLIFYGDIKNAKHYPGLFKTGTPATIEIHRLVVSHQYSRKFNPGIIERKKLLYGKKQICFVLCDRHNAILNFIHSQLAHKANLTGNVSFRDIYDLYLLSKRISLPQIVNEIQFKRKANTYFVFAEKSLGLPGWFCKYETFASKIFLMKHSLNYNSRVFYRTFGILIFLNNRLIEGYIGRLLRSVYSKNERKIIVDCLSNRQWLINHFNSYFELFKPKVK
jgi:hypothetical protein